jgi:cyclopropane-fatty-acyl-phospholipid synthase
MLHAALANVIHRGRLIVAYADGTTGVYGDGSGSPVRLRLTGKGALHIITDQGLGLGEAYMDGDLAFEEGDMWALLSLVGQNWPLAPRADGPLTRLKHGLLRRIRQSNDRSAARQNVAHHYDLSADLYRRFLDADMQYSCAYFPRSDMSLEAAQEAKKAHIAAKLDLRPGLRVLDIGCGWGGMALTLARDYGAVVTGITLSAEQLAIASQRASEAGLAERARFELADYRDVQGPFDRIVSVGMFEHVGAPNYLTFFSCVNSLLTEDGVALIHSIGCKDPPGVADRFIRKYIFPGGFIPALSQITTAVQETGLWITDLEILRLHYAHTLSHWRRRFAANRAEIAELYDERFCRMWEFYLGISELSFRVAGHMVVQVQLAKRVDALPITRDYIFEQERVGGTILQRRARKAG